MSYTLGVDLGTVRSTAAVESDGRVRPCALGDDGFTAPSYVLRRDDGRVRIGEVAALHDGIAAVQAAREAAKRISPLHPGASGADDRAAAEAEHAMALLLTAIIDHVEAAQGGRPAEVVLAQPSTLVDTPAGPYHAVVAGMEGNVRLVPSAVAALTKADRAERLAQDDVTAVMDVGNDLVEVTLVRRTDDGFEMLGRPAVSPGIVGQDFDTVVLAQVDAALDGAVSSLGDPALNRLAAACRASAHTLLVAEETTIEVPLPRMPARVRLTRTDLQRLLAPRMAQAADVLLGVLADAALTSAELAGIVLVGGQARLPVTVDIVTERLGRAPTVEPAPELTVAFGAALMGTAMEARRALPRRSTTATPSVPATATPAPAPAAEAPPEPPPAVTEAAAPAPPATEPGEAGADAPTPAAAPPDGAGTAAAERRPGRRGRKGRRRRQEPPPPPSPPDPEHVDEGVLRVFRDPAPSAGLAAAPSPSDEGPAAQPDDTPAPAPPTSAPGSDATASRPATPAEPTEGRLPDTGELADGAGPPSPPATGASTPGTDPAWALGLDASPLDSGPAAGESPLGTGVTVDVAAWALAADGSASALRRSDDGGAQAPEPGASPLGSGPESLSADEPRLGAGLGDEPAPAEPAASSSSSGPGDIGASGGPSAPAPPGTGPADDTAPGLERTAEPQAAGQEDGPADDGGRHAAGTSETGGPAPTVGVGERDAAGTTWALDPGATSLAGTPVTDGWTSGEPLGHGTDDRGSSDAASSPVAGTHASGAPGGDGGAAVPTELPWAATLADATEVPGPSTDDLLAGLAALAAGGDLPPSLVAPPPTPAAASDTSSTEAGPVAGEPAGRPLDEATTAVGHAATSRLEAELDATRSGVGPAEPTSRGAGADAGPGAGDGVAALALERWAAGTRSSLGLPDAGPAGWDAGESLPARRPAEGDLPAGRTEADASSDPLSATIARASRSWAGEPATPDVSQDTIAAPTAATPTGEAQGTTPSESRPDAEDSHLGPSPAGADVPTTGARPGADDAAAPAAEADAGRDRPQLSVRGPAEPSRPASPPALGRPDTPAPTDADRTGAERPDARAGLGRQAAEPTALDRTGTEAISEHQAPAARAAALGRPDAGPTGLDRTATEAPGGGQAPASGAAGVGWQADGPTGPDRTGTEAPGNGQAPAASAAGAGRPDDGPKELDRAATEANPGDLALAADDAVVGLRGAGDGEGPAGPGAAGVGVHGDDAQAASEQRRIGEDEVPGRRGTGVDDAPGVLSERGPALGAVATHADPEAGAAEERAGTLEPPTAPEWGGQDRPRADLLLGSRSLAESVWSAPAGAGREPSSEVSLAARPPSPPGAPELDVWSLTASEPVTLDRSGPAWQPLPAFRGLDADSEPSGTHPRVDDTSESLLVGPPTTSLSGTDAGESAPAWASATTVPEPSVGPDADPRTPERPAPSPSPSPTGIAGLDALPWMPSLGPPGAGEAAEHGPAGPAGPTADADAAGTSAGKGEGRAVVAEGGVVRLPARSAAYTPAHVVNRATGPDADDDDATGGAHMAMSSRWSRLGDLRRTERRGDEPVRWPRLHGLRRSTERDDAELLVDDEDGGMSPRVLAAAGALAVVLVAGGAWALSQDGGDPDAAARRGVETAPYGAFWPDLEPIVPGGTASDDGAPALGGVGAPTTLLPPSGAPPATVVPGEGAAGGLFGAAVAGDPADQGLSDAGGAAGGAATGDGELAGGPATGTPSTPGAPTRPAPAPQPTSPPPAPAPAPPAPSPTSPPTSARPSPTTTAPPQPTLLDMLGGLLGR